MAQRRDTRKGQPQPPRAPADAPAEAPVDIETGRVRSQIDQGKFRDKIPGEDPATAPLGTDDEAAGTPAPASATQRVDRTAPAHQAPEGHRAGPVPSHRRGMMALASAFLGIVLLGLLVLLLVGSI